MSSFPPNARSRAAHRSRLALLSLSLIPIVALACSAAGSGGSPGNGGGGSSGTNAGGAGGSMPIGVGGTFGSGTLQVDSLEIDPASATLKVDSGKTASLAFKAIAHFPNGSTGELEDVAWSA